MTVRSRAMAVLGMALALGACATAPSPAPVDAPRVAEPAPPAPPPAVVAPAPPPPSPRQRLAAQHRERAVILEADGQLRRAREEWKIALTIDPDDADARAGLRALESRIEWEVSTHIQEGRAALKRGVTAEARRRFLAALAIDPANRTAFRALQDEVREPEFVIHTVRAGDTLRSLAERYYGDRARSEVIAETNQLAVNARLAAGARIRIPEIPGVPFAHPEAGPPEPARTLALPLPPVELAPAAEAAPPDPAPAPPLPPAEPAEVNPLLQEARASLEKGNLVAALGGVDRYLESVPGSDEGLDLKKVVLYQQGKSQLAERKYGDSYRTLTQLARLEPDYKDTPALLRQARARLVDQHYLEGIRMYREEKLPDAIAEWRAVLEFDPEHAGARRNIEQAERLLRGLQERQRR